MRIFYLIWSCLSRSLRTIDYKDLIAVGQDIEVFKDKNAPI